MILRLAAISAVVAAASWLSTGAATAQTQAPANPVQTLGIDTGTTGGKALPVSIAADNGIEWRQADHVYIARGNVKAVRGTLTVYADEMRAYYRPVAKKPENGKSNAAPPPKPQQAAAVSPGKPPKSGKSAGGPELNEGSTEIYRIEAIGNVKFVTKAQTGYGDHADYDVDATRLVLTGKNLKIVTPHDLLTARDSIEWYDNRQIGVARGDAVDVHDGRTIAADVLIATIVHPPGEEAHATRVDGDGNVLVSSKDQIGRGDTGVYDVKSGIVTLSGHVRLTRGQDEMRGNYGVVDVNRNVGHLLSRPPGSHIGNGSPHRVEALIMPKKSTAKTRGSAKDKKPGTGGTKSP